LANSSNIALHMYVQNAPANGLARIYRLIASIGEEQSITHPQNKVVALQLATSIYLVQFVLAMEDKRFWMHPGIDPFGIGRAIIMRFLGRGSRQGGSTIPEQVLKLRAGNTQIKEISERIMRAGSGLRLNFHESKADILADYFQRIYLGGSCYGVMSAAQKYFKCSPSDLTPAQSFFISERIGSPNVWRYGRLKNIISRMVIRRLLGQDLIYLPVIYGKFFGHRAEVGFNKIISQTTDVSDSG